MKKLLKLLDLKLETIPGVDTITAIALVAHIGDIKRGLYGVFYFLAVQQIQVSKKGTPRNPVFLEYYKRKISEGKTKIQALVCVMRRLNNIIYGMMKNKTEYVMPNVEIKEVA